MWCVHDAWPCENIVMFLFFVCWTMNVCLLTRRRFALFIRASPFTQRINEIHPRRHNQFIKSIFFFFRLLFRLPPNCWMVCYYSAQRVIYVPFDAHSFSQTIGPSMPWALFFSANTSRRSISKKSIVRSVYKRINVWSAVSPPFFSHSLSVARTVGAYDSELLKRYDCVEWQSCRRTDQQWWITKTFCWKIAHSCAICFIGGDEQCARWMNGTSWTEIPYSMVNTEHGGSHFAIVVLHCETRVRTQKKENKIEQITRCTAHMR